ncbi:MAG: undecaprenyl-phosphate glucose phosphotransferase [Bacteroidales bacterium]
MIRRIGKSRLIPLIVVLGDFIIINVLFETLFYIPWPWRSTNALVFANQMLIGLNFSYFPIAYILKYEHERRIFEIDKMMRMAFYSVIAHFVVFYLIYNFLNLHAISFRFLIVYFVAEFVAVFSWWVLGRTYIKSIRKKGLNFRSLVVVGAGRSSVEIVNKIIKDPSLGFRFLGFFDDGKNSNTGTYPLLGKIEDFESYISNHHVDEVYCILPDTQGDRINHLLACAEKHLVRFFIIPCYYTYLKRKVELRTINNVPFLSLFNDPLEYELNRFVKRALDVFFALFVLIFIFPILYIITAIAIKLSSKGPVFFKQERTGLNGDDFVCYKFRTMRVNKDADKLQAVKDDPRKTIVGDFLRRSNIDEIPQFINVLKGDMSVVGPRPHMLKHTEDYSALIDTYMIRHFVKPGVTGWAQVNGYRGETKELHQMEKRVEKDVWYIENWSLWLDIKIIVMTIVNVVRGEKNAY